MFMKIPHKHNNKTVKQKPNLHVLLYMSSIQSKVAKRVLGEAISAGIVIPSLPPSKKETVINLHE